MRLLTATAATQGRRADDFHGCVEGELVWVQEEELDREQHADGDGRRSWVGISSRRVTTTAVVADLSMTVSELRRALRGYLGTAGWAAHLPDDGMERMLTEEVEVLVRIGGRYPVGTVVERQGPLMRARRAARERATRSDVA